MSGIAPKDSMKEVDSYFPPGRFTGKNNPEVVTARKDALQKYFRALIDAVEVANQADMRRLLHKFLQAKVLRRYALAGDINSVSLALCPHSV